MADPLGHTTAIYDSDGHLATEKWMVSGDAKRDMFEGRYRAALKG